MKAIIPAAGIGTRLRPHTYTLPKALLYVAGKPIISHIVDGLPKELPIIISTNAVFENEFKKWAKDYADRDVKIFVEDSVDDEFKKGALGATAMVIGHEKIEEDLLLIARDNYFGF